MGIVLLLFALLMGAPSLIAPPAGGEVRIVVRDLVGQPVAGVTLSVSGATPATGVTSADGTAVFVAEGDAVTITAAQHAGKVLLLDHTDPAGLRIPLRGGAVTLELWLAEDQLFVPPATDEGPPPADLATPTTMAGQGVGGREPTPVLAEPISVAPTLRGGVGGSSVLTGLTLLPAPAQEPARAVPSAAPARTPSPAPVVATPVPVPAGNGWFVALVVVLVVVLPVGLLGWAQGRRERAGQEGR